MEENAMRTVVSRGIFAMMLSVFTGPAYAEELRPFACASGFTNHSKHVIWGAVQGTDKAASYLAKSVFRCYERGAGPEREECIQRVRDRHHAWTQAFTGVSPECLDREAIMDSTVARMRTFGDRIYCDGGASRCQKKAARVAGDLAIRLIGLHMGYFWDFWRGECCQKYEDVAKRKFERSITRLPDDCPPCLDLSTFADDLDQHVDDHNVETYCASESALR